MVLRQTLLHKKGNTGMRIEKNDLIIRNFELSDQNDLCEYMTNKSSKIQSNYITNMV